MQTLIHKKPILGFAPQFLQRNFFQCKDHDFFRINPQKSHRDRKTLTLCSIAIPQSPNYGGWDNFQQIVGSVNSGESNLFRNFMNSLGIGDKKYAFVYLLGFVCALAISRVRVSSIVVFPACAIVFAVGFSVGIARGGQSKELRLNGSKKKSIDENSRGSIEKLRNLGHNLGECNAKVMSLKNDITRSIECNQVTVNDLEGYIDVIESADSTFKNTLEVVESCVQSILVGSPRRDGSSDKESGKRRKQLMNNGFNFSQYVGGLFGAKLDSSPPNKMEFMDTEASDLKLDNILMPSVRESHQSGNVGNKNTVRDQCRGENFVDGNGIEDIAVEDDKKNVVETNDTADAFFDQTIFNYKNKASRIVRDQHMHLKDYPDEMEPVATQTDSFSSVDFSISMNHIKTEASFGRKRRQEIRNRDYSFVNNIEEDQLESHNFSSRREASGSKRRPSFAAQKSAQENGFGSSPSSILDNDLEFSRYLAEAKNLLKEAKGCLEHWADDANAEQALYKSARLLLKAIDMRPMSLLAVGQLGNTYLLHGELKLRKSRQLRSRLLRVGSMSVEEMGKARRRIDDPLANKDKIISALMNVCEECEELLIKAGRTYKMALSIDGNDIRALYNWGLALSFRAQLIADIGPAAARDADKVFMAAIDKFDAMMSKSNDYAPDALFRWGAALQQRSRLRPGRSREKMKLLQQARQLYEDALDMDSGNPQLQEALSSCVSELDYWHS